MPFVGAVEQSSLGAVCCLWWCYSTFLLNRQQHQAWRQLLIGWTSALDWNSCCGSYTAPCCIHSDL